MSSSFECHAYRKKNLQYFAGNFIDITRKSKDHHKARLDMKEIGIRKELHLLESGDYRFVLLPKASFSMTKEEKKNILRSYKKGKATARVFIKSCKV